MREVIYFEVHDMRQANDVQQLVYQVLVCMKAFTGCSSIHVLLTGTAAVDLNESPSSFRLRKQMPIAQEVEHACPRLCLCCRTHDNIILSLLVFKTADSNDIAVLYVL